MNGFIKRILITIIIVVSVSCQTISSQKKNYPYSLLLVATDLPTGYVYSGSDFPENEEGKSIRVFFKQDNGELGTSIIHQINVYVDEEKAIEGYNYFENELFFDDWVENAEMDYNPNHFDDKYNISCVPLYSSNEDISHCILLQQHRNLVFTISVAINQQYITKSDFTEILYIVDNKLPDESIPLPED